MKPILKNLQFWKYGKENPGLGRLAEEGYSKAFWNARLRYSFEYSPDEVSFTDFEIPGRIYFIAGRGDITNPLGFARCVEGGGDGMHAGNASKLDGLDVKGFLRDSEDREVTRSNLGNYDGFDAYTGQGKILSIERIESFAQRQGVGSQLIDFIKSQDDHRLYELIEAEANGIKPVNFFRKNGFIYSGIDADAGEMAVMVWNNPKFKS
jgi:GNAT superfamily N-acetyltransferase